MIRFASTIVVTAFSLITYAAPAVLFADDSTPLGAEVKSSEPIETSEGKRVESLPEVVVEGRGEDLLEIAESASVGRIGQAEFESRPLLRPGELLLSLIHICEIATAAEQERTYHFRYCVDGRLYSASGVSATREAD